MKLKLFLFATLISIGFRTNAQLIDFDGPLDSVYYTFNYLTFHPGGYSFFYGNDQLLDSVCRMQYDDTTGYRPILREATGYEYYPDGKKKIERYFDNFGPVDMTRYTYNAQGLQDSSIGSLYKNGQYEETYKTQRHYYPDGKLKTESHSWFVQGAWTAPRIQYHYYTADRDSIWWDEYNWNVGYHLQHVSIKWLNKTGQDSLFRGLYSLDSTNYVCWGEERYYYDHQDRPIRKTVVKLDSGCQVASVGRTYTSTYLSHGVKQDSTYLDWAQALYETHRYYPRTISLPEFTDFSFSVFPNPATKEIRWQLEEGLNLTGIEVFNLTGQKIENLAMEENRAKIEHLIPGIYFFRFEVDEIFITKRVIVKP